MFPFIIYAVHLGPVGVPNYGALGIFAVAIFTLTAAIRTKSGRKFQLLYFFLATLLFAWGIYKGLSGCWIPPCASPFDSSFD